jgi:hypothetical protein
VLVTIGRDGQARAQGAARIRHSNGTMPLVAERSPTAASCADADGDGRVGLTLLTFTLRDVRTGERVAATVVPNDGEADDPGLHPATIVLDGRVSSITAPGTLRVKGRFG